MRRVEDAKSSEDLGMAVQREAPMEVGRMKAELLRPEEIEIQGRAGEMIDEERTAQQRWKDLDKVIDEYAEKIGENVAELRGRAEVINEALERQEQKLENLDKDMDVVGEEMETSTKRLKKVLAKVKAGDKFCVTLCLLVVLVGLLTVAYNMLSA